MTIAQRGSPENKTGPTLDRSRAFATIAAGADQASDDPLRGVAYYQDGRHYWADGTYHSGGTKAMAPPLVEAKAAQIPTDAGLGDEEVAALLAAPEAAQFLEVDVPTLQGEVTQMGGPTFSGENARNYLVAWLLKNSNELRVQRTLPPSTDEQPPADDPPVT